MAAFDTFNGLSMLKNSKILVNVDEALQDVLVVTYALEDKLYQGVLLDSSKRILPCGIIPPPEALSKKTEGTEEDKFYSITQRFTYFQNKPTNAVNGNLLSNANSSKSKPTSRLKPARMTVRLRPRQVLCSKCRSICNENSENVDHSSSTKKTHDPLPETKNQVNQEKLTITKNLRSLRPTLIPKLSRLQPNEITNAINGKVVTRSSVKCNLVEKQSNVWLNPTTPAIVEPSSPTEDARTSPVDDTDREDDDSKEGEEEDGDGKMVLRKKRSVGSMEDLWDENVFVEGTKKARTTPVIKISFGSQGEGTVLKIPSKVQNCSESEPEEKRKTASAKAAKRALKKAKKEARRKLGTASPGASPAYEALHYRRHRHKVKHKKKHKEDRSKDVAVYSDMKERCLKQKLSISLRRLNANAYAHRNESGSSDSGSSSSSSEEAMPDFPSRLSPLPDPEGTSALDTNCFSEGDVVWGKIQGFPWWPGKVVKLCSVSEGEVAQAHVTWYGSSTSSVISCQQLSPFLETFKARFNKKKKSGPYKEAIRQATSEASDISQKILHSPLHSIMSSPTPVHVSS